MITDGQKAKSLSLLQDFLASGETVLRKGGAIKRTVFQDLRKKAIEEIRPEIAAFIDGNSDVDSFKKKIDGLNKKNNHWGFPAIKGQMFFNTLTNTSNDKEKLTKELQNAISLPKDITDAKEKINRFSDYVTSLMIDGADRRKYPNVSSVPYFLSYFWQILDYTKYPVFYHSTDVTFKDLGFLSDEFENWGDRYINFYNLLEELRQLFKEHLLRDVSFWDVEHVFWYSYNSGANVVTQKPIESKKGVEKQGTLLASEYIPPIVSEVALLAKGDESMVNKYDKEEKKVEDVFEDKLYRLFVMLGYETEKYGHGKGRVPDGIAFAREEQYAVIYDAKSRQGAYSIGTDSRAIIEYINAYSRRLRKEGIRNIYFAIISSDFKDNQTE